MLNRYATYTTKDDLDMVYNNIKKYGGEVVSVSCAKDENYLIIYKAKEIIKEEMLKEFGV